MLFFLQTNSADSQQRTKLRVLFHNMFQVTDGVGGREDVIHKMDQSEFSILIQDENDNSPYFDWNQQTVQVEENTGLFIIYYICYYIYNEILKLIFDLCMLKYWF